MENLTIRCVEGVVEASSFQDDTGLLHLVVNKINYTFSFKHSFYFKVGNHVKIVFHGKYDEIDAVLKLDDGLLYLNPEIYQVNSNKLYQQLHKTWFYAFWSVIILVLELVIYQLVMDNTVYYFDIAKYVLVIFTISVLLSIYYLLHRLSHRQYQHAQQVFELLHLPDLEQDQLQYLRMTNSYFEVIPDLYFMEYVLNISKKNNLIQSKALVERMCNQRNSENLTEFQELKFKLQAQKGKIKNIQYKKIPLSAQDTDPFNELTATLNDLPIYGYFDEIYFKNDQDVELVLTQFPDEKGYYIWYLYDQKRYLYLDEDQPTTLSQYHGWAECIIMIIVMAAILFFIWLFFALIADFVFFTYLYFAIMLLVILYQVALVFYKRKFDTEAKMEFYIYNQITALIKLPRNIHLSDLILYKIDRDEAFETKSRTGYDLTLNH
ncbi:MAG: hypothetical protein GAK29_04400 [Acinetobacter bereziniae]|uniref:Uncharacterized protein n=1 Tax=Acinetobacter bereziniae TaxID=106648 RepID=A0A833U9C9_ACIBZ|nr:MAG: hypothetical protein GAK29_04400 [Acinetobacter bereziniae]